MIHHRWDITPREAIALQRELAAHVVQAPLTAPVHTIAGTDCAFVDGGKRIIAAAVLCDARTQEVIATAETILPCTFPYVPGLLSFREAPAIIEVLGKLPVRPDVLMIDGQGLAHPRGVGIATHVGLWLDCPAIGVAKSRLCGEHRDVGPSRGCSVRLMFEGRPIGRVLRTQRRVRPLYISVGHRITIDESILLTLACARRYRLPEPTRRAHMYVTAMKAAVRRPG